MFLYIKKSNLFILSIVLDENLFVSYFLALRTERKALGIHEFVHCVATMMSLARLGDASNLLLDKLQILLQKKVTVTTSEDFKKLYNALGSLSKTEKECTDLVFNDSHFRIGFEDFQGDYEDLYLDFLFSFNRLLEFLTDSKYEQFKNLLETNDSNNNSLINFLDSLFKEIENQKALKHQLVVQRFIMLLPCLVKKIKADK